MKDFDGALADFAEAEKIDPTAPQIAGNRCITYGMMGKFDQAFADCNGLIEKQPKNVYAINNRADVSMMKGDLDAALKDYNAALQINPNNVRAHSGRGQIYERRNDLAQARADYRSAAYSLTKFDELDVARARAIAQERLAALTPQAPAGATGRRVALVIGNGAYKNVHALPNPPRDSKLIASVLRDRRLPDRDVRQRPHPRQVLRDAEGLRRAKRKRPTGPWSIMPATASRSAG